MRRVLLGHVPELSLGFLLTFGSSIGQTFFISLFAGEIRNDLDLTHGMFGTFYSVATLMSAITFLWIGKLTDKFNPIQIGMTTLIALSGFAMLMASTETVFILFFSFFGLRLFGQSLLGHIAITAMARWFSKERGQALSIASLGHALGEAILPVIIVFFLTMFNWREIWVVVSLSMIVIFLPILFWLGNYLDSQRLNISNNNLTNITNFSHISWTRAQVLKDLRFYQLMPGILSSPFIITGVLFHQVHLVETKSWSLAIFASCYPLYALSATGVTLGVGWLVDRLSAVFLLRFYLLPLGLALILLAVTDKTYAAPLFMVLMGASAGAATVITGALWVELYGTDNIGSIRSMCFTMLVVSTAIAPSLIGFLIDIGITLEAQFTVSAIYIFIYSINFATMTPNLLIARSPPS